MKEQFLDITKLYSTTNKKAVITTGYGNKFKKTKNTQKNYPSTNLCNFAILCKIIGFKKIKGFLINVN